MDASVDGLGTCLGIELSERNVHRESDCHLNLKREKG
jgi:hypothetical protein